VTIETRYRAKRSEGWAPQVELEKIVEETLADAHKHGEKYRIRWPEEADFGPLIDADQLSKKLNWRLPKDASVSPGDTVTVFCEDGERLRIRKEYRALGLQIVRAARSQLGVPYVFGSADPTGPGDHTAAFDCSGLTMWAYAQVGTKLLHSAEGQRTSATVDTYDERSKIVPGDLVFYHTGRLAPGVADHVGIASSRSDVIDASSSFDEVVERDIDANPVMAFGRIGAVNGPLG
jgi:cell wall-associated NlpC family hydrolase